MKNELEGTLFSRIEESRQALENELGMELFIKIYRHVQVLTLNPLVDSHPLHFQSMRKKNDPTDIDIYTFFNNTFYKNLKIVHF